MKYLYFSCFLVLLATTAFAQNKVLDSLKTVFTTLKKDSSRAKILLDIGNEYAQDHPDSELFKAQQALFISRRAKYVEGELRSLKEIAESYAQMGNYPIAPSILPGTPSFG